MCIHVVVNSTKTQNNILKLSIFTARFMRVYHTNAQMLLDSCYKHKQSARATTVTYSGAD